MSLRFAILTALSERESTGIELARRFDRSIGHFWPASHQQIYREIDALKTAKLISASPVAKQTGRGRPQVLRITRAGTAALRDWISQVEDPAPVRESLYVRVRASAALEDTVAVRAALEHHVVAHEERLAQYLATEARDFAVVDGVRASLQLKVLQAGIALEQAMLQWCRDVLRELDRIDKTNPGRNRPG